MSGLYVPLQANFFGDDKVILCTPLAKLVYIQGLCIAKLMSTDGIVTRAQLKRECTGIRQLERYIAELVDVGLWSEVGGSDAREVHDNVTSAHEADMTAYATNAWLKHNKSQEWIESYRAARAEDGKRGGRPPKRVDEPKETEKGNPFEVEKGNPFDSEESQKGTENLEAEGREREGKAAPASPANNSQEARGATAAAVVQELAKRRAARKATSNVAGYEHVVAAAIEAERGDEIRKLIEERPTADTEQIVTLLDRPVVNTAKATPFDSQQAAQQKLANRSERQRLEDGLHAAGLTGDPEAVRAFEADLAALDSGERAPLPPDLLTRARHEEDALKEMAS